MFGAKGDAFVGGEAWRQPESYRLNPATFNPEAAVSRRLQKRAGAGGSPGAARAVPSPGAEPRRVPNPRRRGRSSALPAKRLAARLS